MSSITILSQSGVLVKVEVAKTAILWEVCMSGENYWQLSERIRRGELFYSSERNQRCHPVLSLSISYCMQATVLGRWTLVK